MALDFIDIIHINKDGEEYKSHFSLNGKKDIPNTLRVSGVLPHNEVITFSRKSAKKMRDFCQGILDCYSRQEKS